MHYAVVMVTPTSEEWIPGYVAAVSPMVEKYGGRYLARTTSLERIEGTGENPAVMAIIEWPSREAAQAFYADADYQPHLDARLTGAENHFFLVEGKDDFSQA